MDPITLSLIGAAIGGAGNIFGSWQSSKANRKYDSYLKDMSSRLNNWYNKEYNTPYLDTEEAKSILREMQEQMKETNDDMASSAAITGASGEKQVAVKDKMNKNYTGAVNRLAGMGTQRKQGIQGQYMNQLSQLDQLKLQNMLGKSQNWNQFGQNASNIGQNLILSQMMGGDSGSPLSALLNRKNNLNALGMPSEAEVPFEDWMTNILKFR